MARALDEIDRRLLERVQESIPLTSAPFAQIGRELELAEEEVLNRLIALKSAPSPVIRQISAIFDSQSLGYQSCLVAAKIAPSRLEQAAAIISAHPGVSHNYQREHEFNLWFTLAVPPDSALGLDRTIEILRHRSGADSMRKLQTLKLFKIGVKLHLTNGPTKNASASQPALPKPHPMGAVTEFDKVLIRVLQQDLPLAANPFAAWARQANLSENQLLAQADAYIHGKWMRRFAAVLHHREAGFEANGMGVWAVPAPQQEEFGRIAAGFAQVSHCYLRPTYPDWPYNIFTMVHAHSREECEEVLATISAATRVTSCRSLYSTREFKKIRIAYFTADIPSWEQGALNEVSSAP